MLEALEYGISNLLALILVFAMIANDRKHIFHVRVDSNYMQKVSNLFCFPSSELCIKYDCILYTIFHTEYMFYRQ